MTDTPLTLRVITHAEYQRFLADQMAAGDYHQPDHWEQMHFPEGLADKPVVGVRPEDAVAFCQWLDAGELSVAWRHRLPTVQELRQAIDAHPTADFSHCWALDAQQNPVCLSTSRWTSLTPIWQMLQLDSVMALPESTVATLFFTRPHLLSYATVLHEGMLHPALGASQVNDLFVKLIQALSLLRTLADETVVLWQPIVQYFEEQEETSRKAYEAILQEFKKVTPLTEDNRERNAKYIDIEIAYTEALTELEQWLATEKQELADLEQQQVRAYAMLALKQTRVERQLRDLQAQNAHSQNVLARQRDALLAEIAADKQAVIEHIENLLAKRSRMLGHYEHQRQMLLVERDAAKKAIIQHYEALHQEQMVHLRQLKALRKEYQQRAQQAIQDLHVLQTTLSALPTDFQATLALARDIKHWLGHYFVPQRHHIWKLATALHKTLEHVHTLADMGQKDTEAVSDVASMLDYIHNFDILLPQALTVVDMLCDFIDLSLDIESALKKPSEKVAALQWPALQMIQQARHLHPALARSFALSYDFLRLRGRSLSFSSPEAAYQRLRYVRMCALGLLVQSLVVDDPDDCFADVRHECARVCVELCTLEARIRGEAPAFESLCVVREPVVALCEENEG